MKRQVLALFFATIAAGCGSGSTPSSPLSASNVPTQLTVKVVVSNQYDNAQASDVTVKVNIGSEQVQLTGGTDFVRSLPSDKPTQIGVQVVLSPDFFTASVDGCSSIVQPGTNLTCTVNVREIPPPTCDSSILKFIYRPSRLQIGNCVIVIAEVRGVESEHDGDAEIWLQPKDETILAPGNSPPNGNGFLLAEIPCYRSPDAGNEAEATCRNYTGLRITSLPTVGRSGIFVGYKANDGGHGFWAEVHPHTWYRYLTHALNLKPAKYPFRHIRTEPE